MDFEAIKKAAQGYQADMTRFLRDMIAIPSESCEEKGVANRIAEEMKKLGYDKVEFDKLGNVIGWMGTGDKIIALDSHIDTVGIGNIENWTHDPYQGYEDEKVIYGHAALLVGAAAAVDDLVGLVALIGIGIPVLDVADADGVDVGVDGDDLVALAHKAHDVAQAVDLDLIIAKALHLGLNAGNNLTLLARLRGMGDHSAQEASHISTMGLSSSLDSVEIEFFSHCS